MVGLVLKLAVGIGARRLVGECLRRAATMIGMKGRILKKLLRDAGKKAANCSRWIYVQSRKLQWESMDVGGVPLGSAVGALTL